MNIKHVIGKSDGSYTVEFNTGEGEACLVISEDGCIRELHLPPASMKLTQHGLITALFLTYALHRQDWREQVKEGYCKALEEKMEGKELSDQSMNVIFDLLHEMQK